MKAEPNCSLHAIFPTSCTRLSAIALNSNMTTYHDREISGIAQHDSESGPNLPRHDEATSNYGGRNFSGENRDGDFLETHANTEQNTASSELAPMLGQAGSNRGKHREDGSDEDGTTTTNEIIDGVRNPGSAE